MLNISPLKINNNNHIYSINNKKRNNNIKDVRVYYLFIKIIDCT